MPTIGEEREADISPAKSPGPQPEESDVAAGTVQYTLAPGLRLSCAVTHLSSMGVSCGGRWMADAGWPGRQSVELNQLISNLEPAATGPAWQTASYRAGFGGAGGVPVALGRDSIDTSCV